MFFSNLLTLTLFCPSASNPHYTPEVVTYPNVDFGKDTHTQPPYLFVAIRHFGRKFHYFSANCYLIAHQHWTLQVWRLVSRGFCLPICLSFQPAFQKETKCPTSPPALHLTRLWWWARCLYIIQSIVLQELLMALQYPSFSYIWLHVYICCLAQGSGCSAKMSGQEESGSGTRRQQCWSSNPALSCLHTVRHVN